MPRFPHSAWMLLKREWAKGNGKLNWKIERGKFLDLLLIMCTLFFRAIIDILTFFLHSAFSTLRISCTPQFPHSAFFLQSLLSTLRIFYTPRVFQRTVSVRSNRNIQTIFGGGPLWSVEPITLNFAFPFSQTNRSFARPGQMVQNYIFWWASCAVGLPKQRQAHCFGSPTVQFAHQYM